MAKGFRRLRCYSGCMPRRAIESVPGQVTQPAPSVEPDAVRPEGVRAALIRKTKLRYPELLEAESQNT